MIYIFLETETPTENKVTNEARFVKYVVEKFTGKKYKADFKIIGFGGYSNFEGLADTLFPKEESDFKNLVIFDADKTGVDGGGFEKRREYLLKIKEKLNLDFELFLFPDNKRDGEFETLLEDIVNPEHKRVIDYFKEYEGRLKGCTDFVYKTPDQKTRMYSYINAFDRSKKENEEMKNLGNWGFDNPEYWDMASSKLDPLKTFFLENIS